MAFLTIRNLDEAIKAELRLQAARHGCSMEEEARRILRRALTPSGEEKGLGSRLHRRFVEVTDGGAELEIPPRTQPRPGPFDDETDG